MKKKLPPAVITSIQNNSIADDLDLMPGDKLIALNGHPLRDILDFYMHSSQETLCLEIEKLSGEKVIIDIEKDAIEPIGISFAEECFDGMISCTNKCIFCFIKGLPKGLRKTLYVKDDDYRYSFLHGNYITLTNLDEKDLRRIVELKLSPLYISVHTTNPDLRKDILGNDAAGDILDKIKYLFENNIKMHTQAVICPEINDGKELENTIKDLSDFFPEILSLAVVPVGLTRYNLNKRDGLRSFSKAEAGKIVDLVEAWQKKLLNSLESRFVFLSDEFYLKSGRKIPADFEYEGYPQYENGVGIVRSFSEDFVFTLNKNKFKNSFHKHPSRTTIILTGMLSAPVLVDLMKKHSFDSNIKILPIKNDFFGSSVTVTGLLTGSDIIKALKDRVSSNDNILISDVVFKDSEEEYLFLDNLTLNQVEVSIDAQITVVKNNGRSLAEALGGGGIND